MTHKNNEIFQREIDERIMKNIKQETEDIRIPEELSPENMMKIIKQQKEIRSKKNILSEIFKFKNTVGSAIVMVALSVMVIIVSAKYGDSLSPNNISSADKIIDNTHNTNNTHSTNNTENSIQNNKDLQNEEKFLGQNVKKFTSKKQLFEYLETEKNDRLDEMTKEDMGSNITNETLESTNDATSESQKDNNSINDYSNTNEQVNGVNEGDIVKTDGKNIYTLDNKKNNIKIVEANNGKMNKLGSIDFSGDLKKEVGENIYINNTEFYLNDNILTLVLNYNKYEKNSNNNCFSSESEEYTDYCVDIAYAPSMDTCIMIYDITDKANPILSKKHFQEGGLKTSRMVGKVLYTISSFNIYNNFCDELTEENCIPKIDNKEIDLDSIYALCDKDADSYMIITSLNIDKLEEYADSKTLLTNSDIFYMSTNNLYLMSSQCNNLEIEDENITVYKNQTQINKFTFNEGTINPVASTVIDGNLNNQFSVDEYKDNLRVVATNEQWTNTNSKDTEEIYREDNNSKSTSVYVLDKDLKEIGKISDLAEGEMVYSARFMGDMGYFVTFKQVDPLFAVDFSNPQTPKIVSQLKIPGFSSYLHFWGEDKLFGLGYDVTDEFSGTTGVKLSMFNIENKENISEENKYVITDVYTNSDYNYKSILASPEKNILGFSYAMYTDNGKIDKYSIFSYDENNGFVEKFTFSEETIYGTEFNGGLYNGEIRGLFIGDTLYIVKCENKIISYNMENYNEIQNFNLEY